MQELKQALTELNITYGKIADLIGAAHPVSKKVLHIIREHNPDNTHQIISEKMGQKKSSRKASQSKVLCIGKMKQGTFWRKR